MQRFAMSTFTCCHATLVLVLILAVAPLLAVTQLQQPIRVLYADGRPAAQKDAFQAYVNQWSNISGIPVLVQFPNVTGFLTSTEYSRLLTLMGAQKSNAWDLFFVDVIWPPRFVDMLRPLDDLLSPGYIDPFDPEVSGAARVQGKLYAVPFHSPRVALYSRTDLLARFNYTRPPRTWAELEQIANHIVPEVRKSNPNFFGYIGQMRPHEGLTCNVVEWLRSFDAGTHIEPDGSISTTDPVKRQRIQDAMSLFRRWMADGLISPFALQAVEASSVAFWQRGDALFMRNWVATAWLTVTGGTAAMSPLPGVTEGLQGASTNGAHFFGMNRNVANASRSARVLEFLASEQTSRWWTERIGLLPARTRLINDATIGQLTGTSGLTEFRPVSRPSVATGANYLAASTLIFNTWHNMLAGRVSITEALDILTYDLADMLKINVLGPPMTVPWTSAFGIITIVLVSLANLVVLLTMWPLVKPTGAQSRELRRASPRLIVTMLVGLMFMSNWPITFLGDRTVAACMMQPVIPGIAWTIILSVMAVQDLQVYLITSSPLRRVAMDVNRRLRIFLAVSALFEAGMLATVLAVNQPRPTVFRVGRLFQYAGCDLGLPRQLLVLPLLMPALLIALNVWLSFRTAMVDQLKTINRVPTLRVVYLVLVLCLVVAIPLLVDSIDPNTRVTIISGAMVAQSVGVTRLYVVQRISPDQNSSTLAWMGQTRIDNDGESEQPSGDWDVSTAGNTTRMRSATNSVGTTAVIVKSDLFSCRAAVSEIKLELKPCVPCMCTLVREKGRLVFVEKGLAKRTRRVLHLAGRLQSVDFVRAAGQAPGARNAKSLRLRFNGGEVAELAASGAETTKLVEYWQELLLEFVQKGGEDE
ncbi:hypothetical protein BCR44DRAFT_137845 [Catenaria anguillulae PL171]|uniref:G-protein coupled receptors family 3 profile domain-containing protein n=1 Tax=Catenaria anguillulae PL171 TaxID=765915 RepID=A0A1Y2HPY1_9FUNG|nr:hypothetical protein BCR44DRAFT_137845 [Catenaria anguillulae PL171]